MSQRHALQTTVFRQFVAFWDPDRCLKIPLLPAQNRESRIGSFPGSQDWNCQNFWGRTITTLTRVPGLSAIVFFWPFLPFLPKTQENKQKWLESSTADCIDRLQEPCRDSPPFSPPLSDTPYPPSLSDSPPNPPKTPPPPPRPPIRKVCTLRNTRAKMQVLWPRSGAKGTVKNNVNLSYGARGGESFFIILGWGGNLHGHSQIGLKATLCNSCAMACNCAHVRPFGPFCKQNFRRKMMTLVGSCDQLRTGTLRPHLRAPI